LADTLAHISPQLPQAEERCLELLQQSENTFQAIVSHGYTKSSPTRRSGVGELDRRRVLGQSEVGRNRILEERAGQACKKRPDLAPGQ
jgi:hypothetical protein